MRENTVARRKMELPSVADTKFTRIYVCCLKFLFNFSTDQRPIYNPDPFNYFRKKLRSSTEASNI